MLTVSIIIPLYNSELYIKTCLESIASQTFKDFEVIMIDDCSTDDSFFIAHDVAKSLGIMYKIIKNEQNTGPSLTREKGINLAEGQYIAFCDSDDYFDYDHIEKLVLNTKKNENDLVFCSYKTVYSNGVIKEHNITTSIMNATKSEIIARGTDSLCCMMVRKGIFDNIEFPDVRNGEDMSIIPIIISLCDKYGFVNECTYNYVYHSGTLSKNPNPEIVNILKESFFYLKQRIGNQYPVETEFLGVRNLLYGGMLNLFKADVKLNEGSNFYKEFIGMYPEWYLNPYVRSLPSYKRLYLVSIRFHLFFTCKVLSKIHMRLSQ